MHSSFSQVQRQTIILQKLPWTLVASLLYSHIRFYIYSLVDPGSTNPSDDSGRLSLPAGRADLGLDL
jgi:hypothetical protein